MAGPSSQFIFCLALLAICLSPTAGLGLAEEREFIDAPEYRATYLASSVAMADFLTETATWTWPRAHWPAGEPVSSSGRVTVHFAKCLFLLLGRALSLWQWQ